MLTLARHRLVYSERLQSIQRAHSKHHSARRRESLAEALVAGKLTYSTSQTSANGFNWLQYLALNNPTTNNSYFDLAAFGEHVFGAPTAPRRADLSSVEGATVNGTLVKDNNVTVPSFIDQVNSHSDLCPPHLAPWAIVFALLTLSGRYGPPSSHRSRSSKNTSSHHHHLSSGRAPTPSSVSLPRRRRSLHLLTRSTRVALWFGINDIGFSYINAYNFPEILPQIGASYNSMISILYAAGGESSSFLSVLNFS